LGPPWLVLFRNRGVFFLDDECLTFSFSVPPVFPQVGSPWMDWCPLAGLFSPHVFFLIFLPFRSGQFPFPFGEGVFFFFFPLFPGPPYHRPFPVPLFLKKLHLFPLSLFCSRVLFVPSAKVNSTTGCFSILALGTLPSPMKPVTFSHTRTSPPFPLVANFLSQLTISRMWFFLFVVCFPLPLPVPFFWSGPPPLLF